ncbi:MAG TPA: hypothetical protein PLV45_18715, partial [bacterium]|nr:hypothetical protein [bacterium]
MNRSVFKYVIAVCISVCAGLVPAAAIQNYNMTDFYYAYGATVALSGSEAFVQLTDPVISAHFEALTEALLLD